MNDMSDEERAIWAAAYGATFAEAWRRQGTFPGADNTKWFDNCAKAAAECATDAVNARRRQMAAGAAK